MIVDTVREFFIFIVDYLTSIRPGSQLSYIHWLVLVFFCVSIGLRRVSPDEEYTCFHVKLRQWNNMVVPSATALADKKSLSGDQHPIVPLSVSARFPAICFRCQFYNAVKHENVHTVMICMIRQVFCLQLMSTELYHRACTLLELFWYFKSFKRPLHLLLGRGRQQLQKWQVLNYVTCHLCWNFLPFQYSHHRVVNLSQCLPPRTAPSVLPLSSCTARKTVWLMELGSYQDNQRLNIHQDRGAHRGGFISNHAACIGSSQAWNSFFTILSDCDEVFFRRFDTHSIATFDCMPLTNLMASLCSQLTAIRIARSRLSVSSHNLRLLGLLRFPF